MENRVKEFEEVRKARRKVQNNTTCRFDSHAMEFLVYELSAHGFSFLCRKESCFFKRGAILDKISVLNAEKMEIIKASGTVMHLADFDFDNFRVGVSYTKKTLDRTISGKVRVPRLTPKIRLDVEISLKHDGNGHIMTGHVIDYTASTSRVKFIGQQPVDLNVGDEVNVHIKAEEKTLFDGEGYIFRTRDEGSEIIIRFMNKFLDVSKVEKTSNAFQNRSVVFSALTSLKNYTDVKDNYKALICDWRLYLNRLKQVFDQEEGKNIYRTDAEQELFLKGIEEKLLRDLHNYIFQMNDMVENLNKNESSNYKKYFRENLNPLLRFSPLISSIIDKDLGYAGDYETIKQFFQNPYSGDTLFGKFVNKYLCSLDAVLAHQDRIQFLYEELCKIYRESKGEFSFLSLGSGPAEEVLRFVERNVFEKPVRATLLDMDAYALADFSDRLQYLPKENFVIDLLNVNILNIIREKEADLLRGKYHLTYCAGLFDYFSETICKRLVKFLITHTESEGEVVITNVHTKNRARHVMEYCGGWEIVHRDEKGMSALVPPECKFEFGFDKTGANIFLRIFPHHHGPG